jgi:hypothetical protein
MCLCIIAIIATVLLYSLTVLVMMCFSHIHTRSALHSRFTVFCVVLPLCTPAFVGDGLATTAPCFATYPHSNCSRVCRLYSRCSLCTSLLYSRFRWRWSGNRRFLLCNISTLKLFTRLSVVLPLFVVFSCVVLPFSLVVVWQLSLLALQHIHIQAAQAFVGCTPVVD